MYYHLQDILTCGFTGGLFAGAIAAQAVLGRNVMGDLVKIHSSIKQGDKMERKNMWTVYIMYNYTLKVQKINTLLN